MFVLSESPTNIIFFPLIFLKKYNPLNLTNTSLILNQYESKPKRRIKECKKSVVPGERTRRWLPSILKVKIVGTTILLAVKLWIYERTFVRIVEWILYVINPTPSKPVASPRT